MFRPKSLGVPSVVALAAALVFAGCGGDTERAAEAETDAAEVASAEVVVETDTEAAGDDTDTDAEPADPNTDADTEPSDSADADATEPPALPDQKVVGGNVIDRVTSGGNKGSRVCVRNETGEPTGLVVDFSKADTSNGGTLRAIGEDQERCAEGTFFAGNDVIGKIYLPKSGANNYDFSATNPWFGLPSADLKQSSGSARYCIAGEFKEQAGSTFDDGIYAITFERLADSNWKEFKLTIKTTSQPASSGVAKECPVSPQPAVAS
jgi:hypothetical protein